MKQYQAADLIQRDPDFVTVTLPEGGTYLLDELTGKVLEVGKLALRIIEICETRISIELCWTALDPIRVSHEHFINTLDRLITEEAIQYSSTVLEKR